MSLCHLFSIREEGSALTLLSSFDKIRSLSLCHYVICFPQGRKEVP